MDKETHAKDLPPPYAKEEARAIFRHAAQTGVMRSSRHARERMQERRLDNNDILKVAKTGIVVKAPELDIKTHSWTYRIESDELKVVFVILDKESVRLITVLTD